MILPKVQINKWSTKRDVYIWPLIIEMYNAYINLKFKYIYIYIYIYIIFFLGYSFFRGNHHISKILISKLSLGTRPRIITATVSTITSAAQNIIDARRRINDLPAIPSNWPSARTTDRMSDGNIRTFREQRKVTRWMDTSRNFPNRHQQITSPFYLYRLEKRGWRG